MMRSGSRSASNLPLWTPMTTTGSCEDFNDEMRFLWHDDDPSQGFELCVDGHCQKANGEA
jgi:hypothetical protein